MPEIKLNDYNPPPLDTTRYFVLDSLSGSFQKKHAKTAEELTRFSCGFGSIMPLKDNKPCFAAIYLDKETIKLRIGDTVVELDETSEASIKSSFPVDKTFVLKSSGNFVVDVNYWHPVDETASDLFEHVLGVLKAPYGLRKFAYLWSATRVGKQRAIPASGLTDDIIKEIRDPYDVDHDVLKEETS